MTAEEKVKKFTVKRFLKLLVLTPFALCVGILLLLGKCTGLSYVQISVVFNLWIQGGVLLLSSFLPLASIIRHCIITDSASSICIFIGVLLLCYASLYVFGFALMLRHYKLPFKRAFNLCVEDLRQVGRWWHMSYYAVNLLIFVYAYLSMLGINILVAYLLL